MNTNKTKKNLIKKHKIIYIKKNEKIEIKHKGSAWYYIIGVDAFDDLTIDKRNTIIEKFKIEK